ncbi:ABC transporter ATP-binding protein/permease [Polynucleobacter sp. 30F-ANTBAC]|jgi:ATP-binding cassette, subfamily B, heavy metal transporter|uniref:ABCB family ABC transporter ATP-binding protein/permease n=1 Tax=Polynucleobacter sp. 30F-ANTBAC TaxID=2689095 RepID=UPI001C0E7B24|nr:ABC transporter ATP-binding protein/permease [Polynucleobacter sp. 30F-ANTBAC]MBU3600219.1 ABC transporter ATP-binding protein/permease [Polynucleobacter sp. 30F-ANTBAC]
MRHLAQQEEQASKHKSGNDWKVIRNLLPYLWTFKGRVILALSCLIAAKVANLGVPILLKELIDAMSVPKGIEMLVVVPVALIIAYGILRLSASLFTELRELLFSRVTESAVRTVALQVFEHLHALSLRFHLSRQTGGVTRDVERGTRGIQSLISYSLYSILPTLVELGLVLGYFIWAYNYVFALITFCALVIYVIFTVKVTEWRTQYRRKMNDLDSKAHQRAVDSLINFETVKYFGNEGYEAQRYDENLKRFREAAIKSQRSLALLNAGQQTIIAIGLILILWQATIGVASGSMTIGDLVLVNVLMIQLYIPLNFLGVIYREIKQALTDMDRMFSLLQTDQEISDSATAKDLLIHRLDLGPQVSFENVNFSYEPNRVILDDLSFEILPGQTTAVVGHSGAGKSTLARLLFRFYDVSSGAIKLDQQNIKDVKQISLRQAIGIVPQDTVLFNDTIAYNIAYGKPGASQEEVEAAARSAQIHDFIMSLPDGYKTTVGERGLKLSGGEKQRVAIARTLLKNPALLIFDEATSALDSETERAIQKELMALAQNRTTLIIAHRLSTVIHAHQILVMDGGKIIERGTHDELLAQQGRYAEMWRVQQSQIELIS